jgi:hypothetical protein
MERNKPTCTSTLLVQHIGIPGTHGRSSSRLRDEDFQSLLQSAEQNKISLLFLQAVNCNRNIQPILSHYEERYKDTLNLITYAADLLNRTKVPYALFKTLKPFPYVPSDIDILLRSDESLQAVAGTLKNHGCVPLKKDNYGLTMFSPEHKMNIDLTTQIAVSGLVYANKQLLFDHLCEVQVNDVTVQKPEPKAELLVASAHSVFKEQTYTLSDYYTFVLSTQHWKEATKLAENFFLEYILDTTLRITKRVTETSFGSMKTSTKRSGSEGTSVKDFELPKKYALSSLMVAFLKKIIADPVSKQSLPVTARSIYEPAFYKKIVEHATRKTY